MATIGQRVLVIEDDEGMREAIESLLGAAGYATASFASAEALLAAGAVGGVCCIVSDVRLPAMSGLELVDELRRRSNACPPVIVITAHDSAAVRDGAARRGAAYLTKPFAGAELLQAVALACGGSGPGTRKTAVTVQPDKGGNP